MRKKVGAILLFDFKIKNNKVYVLEAGCGFNSSFHGYQSYTQQDLRTKTVSEIAKVNPKGTVYLDSSMLLGGKIFFDFIFRQNITAEEAQNISLIASNANANKLGREDIIITCNPDSPAADIATLKFCEKNLNENDPIFMMGNRATFALTEDKVLLSRIFKPQGDVRRPWEKLVNLQQLTNADINQLPYNGPFVLKPTNAGEARGVLVLKDKEELQSIINIIKTKQSELQPLKPELRRVLLNVYYDWLRDKNSFSSISVSVTMKMLSCKFFSNYLNYNQKNEMNTIKDLPSMMPDETKSEIISYWIDFGESITFNCNTKNTDEVKTIRQFLEILSEKKHYTRVICRRLFRIRNIRFAILDSKRFHR